MRMENVTHESFIEELKEKQPKLYDSIEIISKYESKNKHILVKDKYGICRQNPYNLLYGKTPSIMSAIDKNKYMQNIIKIEHPELYDKIEYFGEYKNAKEDIIIKMKYGLVSTKPSNLIRGKTPRITSAIDKNNYFINNAIDVHGLTYDYSKINYINRDEKICIICPIHDEFWQTPINHLHGFGCEKCGHENGVGKYNKTNAERNKDVWKDTESSVYIVKIIGEKEEFYKIGITIKENILDRFCFGYENYNINILNSISTNLYDAVLIEGLLHDYFSEYRYKPIFKFKGWTECFKQIDLDYINNKYGNLMI